MNPIISFLTDFGTADTSVGQCKAVIAAIAPAALVVDITHGVAPYDIQGGAWALRSAAPLFPPCVHVAVVDPGVGTARRPIAVQAVRGDVLIGPDNGLLLEAAEALAARPAPCSSPSRATGAASSPAPSTRAISSPPAPHT